MKSITVENRILQYETTYETYSCGGGIYVTHFYEGEEVITYRKYWLFGKKVSEKRPKYLFSVYADSMDPNLSRGWWKKEITTGLEKSKRKSELKEGRLI